ncbi:MAG: hypothetical protein GH155_07535 [Spirochaeta sp.]|nr:hypothetical protein [Spirochaeta sp.]
MTLMRVIFSFIIALAVVFMVPAATLDVIDTAAEEFGSFITSKVDDQEGYSISINPFLSDRSGQSLLGERIRSSLELYLALHYQKTRVLSSPEGYNHYTVTGEIMSFLSQVRLLVKIYNPDGSLAGGIKYDLEIDTELEQLLAPREENNSFQSTPDPYEPDDLPGFEVKVEEQKLSIFGRFLTPGDIDRFLFYLPLPGNIIIEAVAETDLQLLLFRGGEEIPFMAQPSRIEEHLPTGVYILEITAYDFDLETAYQLLMNLATIGDDSYEPDDTLEEATEIVSGSSQERIIAAGNYDWVEMKSALPGFYLLSAEDSDILLRLALFDNREREIINNYSYAGHEQNAIPVFLGTRRLFAMISAQDPDEAAAYKLALHNIEPIQIHPNGNKIFLKSQDDFHYLKLRILQQGIYRIRAESERYPVIIRVYNLPNMQSIEKKTDVAYPLTPGDYLIALSVSGKGGESIEISVNH